MAKDRVMQFLQTLAGLTDENEIKILCKRELDYLRKELGIEAILNDEGYPIDVKGNATRLRTQLTPYRNGIRDLELNEKNSDSKVKKGQIVKTHKALRYLNLADYEKENANTQQQNRNFSDKSDRPSFNPFAVIEKAKELLKSDSYVSRLAGLYVLTGRRHSELMQTAIFEETGLSCNILQKRNEDTVFHALFWGQQKTTKKGQIKKVDIYGLTKQNDTPYKIPLLCEIELIQESIQWLREKHYQDPNKRAKGSKELGVKVRKEFSKLLSDVTPHKLRSAYCCMVWAIYKDAGIKKPTEDLFIDNVTGHSSETTESASAYMDYSLDPETTSIFKNWFNQMRIEKISKEWL